MTMSFNVIGGKSGPYGRPLAGFRLRGAVEPKLDPSTLLLTTKQRSVSIALPGPTNPLQDPSEAEEPPSAKRWLLV